MVYLLSKKQVEEVARLYYEPRARWLELPKVPWELAKLRAEDGKVVYRITVAQAMAL